jgi:hypothetical protein
MDGVLQDELVEGEDPAIEALPRVPDLVVYAARLLGLVVDLFGEPGLLPDDVDLLGVGAGPLGRSEQGGERQRSCQRGPTG